MAKSRIQRSSTRELASDPIVNRGVSNDRTPGAYIDTTESSVPGRETGARCSIAMRMPCRPNSMDTKTQKIGQAGSSASNQGLSPTIPRYGRSQSSGVRNAPHGKTEGSSLLSQAVIGVYSQASEAHCLMNESRENLSMESVGMLRPVSPVLCE